jgi:hypothetical protein
MKKLLEDLKENDKYVHDDGITPKYTTHPDGTIYLSVDEKHWGKLYIKQYKVPAALKPFVTQILSRWEKYDKIEEAPRGCIFNLPLLIAPKFDKKGAVCGIRICLDCTKLNLWLQQNDKQEIPDIMDRLRQFEGMNIFGEFDLSEAYTQFKIHKD